MSDLNEAKRWIKIAERDYAVASHLQKTLIPLPVEVICFQCQQAVEKALKAILAYNEVEVPKIHDIKTLVKMCQKFTDKLYIDNRIAVMLTESAVDTRYDADKRDYTEDTAGAALKQAKQTLDKVKKILGITQQYPQGEKMSE